MRLKMNDQNNYIIIPETIRYDERIKANYKLLYGEICILADKKGYCTKSYSYFANIYQVSNETISKWIYQLKKYGYISTIINYDTLQRIIIVNKFDDIYKNLKLINKKAKQ